LFVVPTRDVLAFAPVEGPETVASLGLRGNDKMPENPSNPICGHVFGYEGNVFDSTAIMQAPEGRSRSFRPTNSIG
jgi:hypothetical protein